MNRLQRILLILLIIQIVTIAWIYWPEKNITGTGEPLLGELSPSDVISFIIEDNEGNRVELARSDSGWNLPEADNFPAAITKIDPVLEKIAAIETNRLVTRTSASHKRLQVSDDSYQRRIMLKLTSGEEYILYIGSSTGARATHVRLAGESEVYQTGELTSWEIGAKAENWIDTTYISLPIDGINAVTIENPNGVFVFTKDSNGEWTMEDLPENETFDQAQLTSLLSRLTSLTMIEPLGTEEKTEYGLTDPQATIILNAIDPTLGAQTYTIQIGAQDPQKTSYVIHATGEPYYVRVNNFTVEDFVQKQREDFFSEPPTPTPAP
jgi:hypothetical protein